MLHFMASLARLYDCREGLEANTAQWHEEERGYMVYAKWHVSLFSRLFTFPF